MAQKSGKTIGIDIGDTFFRISYLEKGSPRLVSDSAGMTCFPSKVSFLQGGGCRVGVDAEMFGVPENTVQSPMTIIGMPFTELKLLNSRNVYQFIRGDGQIVIDAHRVFPTVPDVLIAIFAHAKKLAEDHLGSAVTSAVIAIPDGASDPKRILIKKAAEDAGLEVKQLLNQTTAAAFGYRFDLGDRRKRIAVIDMGASHMSCSNLTGGGNQLEMINTQHCEIGTNDLKWRLAELISDLIKREYHIDLLGSEQQFLKTELLSEAGHALVDLSVSEQVDVSIGCALPTGGRAIVTVTRQQFYQKIATELRQLSQTLDGGHSNADLVLLVGGGGNIPVIKEIVDRAFGKPPFLSTNINSAEAVALGAAIKGGILDGIITSQSVEKTVHDLGTFYQGDMMDVLIPRGTQFPCHVAKEYGMFGTHKYWEKVYQWIGSGTGQNEREGQKNLVVLAKKELRIKGGRVRCTFIIDVHGVAQFIVTDLVDNQQFTLTGFAIQ
jgi:molecular chaperone HscA